MKMKTATFNVTDHSLSALEKLVEEGTYSSRSEAIRVAIREFLRAEVPIMQRLRAVHAEVQAWPAPAPPTTALWEGDSP